MAQGVQRDGTRGRAKAVLLLGLALLLAVVGVYYQTAAAKERALLQGLIAAHTGASGSAKDKLVRSTALAFTIPSSHARERAWNPVERLLRPSAYQVYLHGGVCTGRSRLLIRLLALQGIRAHKLYLYNPVGLQLLKDPPRAWVHVVVEAWIGGRWVVADPLFNVVFEKPDGSPATAEELAHDRALLTSGRDRAEERFDNWEDVLYTYREVRRFPWFAVPMIGERVRDLAVSVLGADRVDSWPTPGLLERPHLTIAVGCWTLVALMGLAVFPWRKLGAPRAASPSPMPLPSSAKLPPVSNPGAAGATQVLPPHIEDVEGPRRSA